MNADELFISRDNVFVTREHAVESGIATFEDEFLAYIMLPDGRTVGGWVGPQLDAAYDPDRGVMPRSLPLLQLGAGEEGTE